METPRKILIIKPSSLGDIIHSLPFLSALRECFPRAEIHWVVAKAFYGLLEGHPMLDRLWVFDKDKWKRLSGLTGTAGEIRAFIRNLKNEKVDMAIDLQGLLRSGLIAWASGAKVKIGFKEAREGAGLFYDHKVSADRDMHAVERYFKVAASIGCNASGVRFPMPPLPPAPVELPHDYIVIAPSAGKEANRWPARRFGELAGRLPFKSVIVASASDSQIADETVAASSGKALSLAGKTDLKGLASVTKGARFLVSGDTGPAHIAAALGIPVFTIFGPANPQRTGPYGDMHTVIRLDLRCSPCYRKKKCRDWKCMEDLTVDMAFDSIRQRRNLWQG